MSFLILQGKESEDFAYMAGVLDSDGSISVSPRKSQHEHPSPEHRRDVFLGQVKIEAIQLFQYYFGGNITVRPRESHKWRDQYIWRASGERAERCLIALLPYLRIKKEQASIFLAMCETYRDPRARRGAKKGQISGHVLPPDIISLRSTLSQKITALNAVGVNSVLVNT